MPQIAETIRGQVFRMLTHPFDINCGECVEFADRLIEIHPVLEIEQTPFESDYPGHVWVSLQVTPDYTLHFDAEEPEGIRNWEDLPIFHRYRANLGRPKLSHLTPSSQ